MHSTFRFGNPQLSYENAAEKSSDVRRARNRAERKPEMNDQVEFPFPLRVPKPRSPKYPSELKVLTLRELRTPEEMLMCDTPEKVHAYWQVAVTSAPWYNPECENFVVVALNARHRAKGHFLVSIGTMDTVLSHPREVFKTAIAVSAFALILAHNHPSGDPTPSESDIKVTRDLIRAGNLLRIEVLDHIIIGRASEGNRAWCSLRELGYLYSS